MLNKRVSNWTVAVLAVAIVLWQYQVYAIADTIDNSGSVRYNIMQCDNTKTLDDVINSGSGDTNSKQEATESKSNVSSDAYSKQTASSDDTTSQTLEQAVTGKQSTSDNGFIDFLKGSGNFSVPAQGIEKAVSPLSKWAALIVQFLSYVAVIGLVIRFAIDMIYVCDVPFLAKKLSGGTRAVGEGNGGEYSRFGRYGGDSFDSTSDLGFGNRFGGGYGGGYGEQASQNPNNSKSRCHVSRTALNAVAMSERPNGSDGKSKSAVRLYAEKMIPTMIIVPILLTLSLTGIMYKIGFGAGKLISDIGENVVKLIG